MVSAMKVKSISYGRTFSDGKGTYEFTRIDVTAEVEANEEPEDAFIKLYDQVVVMRDLQLDQIPKPVRPTRRTR
jgi:hypothetical protein